MYRYTRKGLEVMLARTADNTDGWSIPSNLHPGSPSQLKEIVTHLENQTGVTRVSSDYIPLETTEQNTGKRLQVWAFEAEWNDDDANPLPFTKLLGKEESPLHLRRKYMMLRDQFAFLAIKEAAKKMFPNQVALLKELQEILTERNLLKYF